MRKPTQRAKPDLSEENAPDPARSYERADPDKESGLGRLDHTVEMPASRSDQAIDAVGNAHPPRQIDSDDIDVHPDHSMEDEEPLGEDLMPSDIHNPEQKRHPKKEGRGGTP